MGCWKGEIVADVDDEVRTTVKPQIHEAVKWVLKNLLFELRIYSQIYDQNLTPRAVSVRYTCASLPLHPQCGEFFLSI